MDGPDKSRAERGVSVGRFVGPPLLILAIAGALGLWMLRSGEPPSAPESRPPPAPAAAEAQWIPRPRPRQPKPGCLPRVSQECIDGDVWWLDGCAQAHELAAECGRRLCRDGACEPDDPPNCGGAPIPGRCDENVARGCDAGRPYTIDCEAARCVMTEEGPACRPRSDNDCDWPPGTTRCDASVAVACVGGRLERVDCAEQGGRCEEDFLAGGARCVTNVWPRSSEDCGACGCDTTPVGEEVCDGLDNDADGFIDELVDCGVVDIVAFVIVDSGGRGSYGDADIEAAVARLNDAFARTDGYGLEFRVADIVRLAKGEWLELDESESNEMLASGAVNPERESFYVPIVFTDQFVLDGVPRPGVATPPNGMCGGHKRMRGQQPALGAVIVGKRRWPTTVAHEVGHFLGLCHTHASSVDNVARVVEGEGDEPEACEDPCMVQADGICDTAVDPGPEGCSIDAQCRIECESGVVPDPRNYMAYYPPCRTLFTEQQALHMRRTLARRRGWHKCIFGDGCACHPVGSSCPDGMSCFTWVLGDGESRWLCGLDGASVPGGRCSRSSDCSDGSLCFDPPEQEARCMRACDDTTPACDCRPMPGLEFSLCRDDLAGR